MTEDWEAELSAASIGELAALGAAILARRRGDAEDAVRLGRTLHHVRAARRFEEERLESFDAWVRLHLRIGPQQVGRYLDVRVLPLPLVRGRTVDLQGLAAVARADPALWEALLGEAEEADRARLHRAALAGAPLLAAGDVEGARALARKVARGEARGRPPGVAPRLARRRDASPAALAGRVLRRLRQAQGELAELEAQAAAGRRLSGRWTWELPAEVGALLRGFSALSAQAPPGLLAAPEVHAAPGAAGHRLERGAALAVAEHGAAPGTTATSAPAGEAGPERRRSPRDAADAGLRTRVQEAKNETDLGQIAPENTSARDAARPGGTDLDDTARQAPAWAWTSPSGVTDLEGIDPEVTDFDREALALAGRLRALRVRAEAALGPWLGGAEVADAVQDALGAEGRALAPLCDRLLDELNDGARAADRQDEEAAAAAAALQERQRQLQSQLVYLGEAAPPLTWSVLGWQADGRPVALSRDRGQVILLMGVPGSGKSRAAVGICEAALRSAPGLTAAAERRTAVVLFHADPLGATPPEVLAGLAENGDPGERRLLHERLGAPPAPIGRINLAAPAWLLPSLRARLGPQLAQGLRLVPLWARPAELGQAGLEALLGMGSEAHYVERILDLAQRQGPDLSAERLHALVEEAADLPAPLRRAAHRRLKLLDALAPAGPDRRAGLWDLCAPGELTVLLLGDAQLGTRDALPLTAALMAGLSQPSERHGPFQRLFYLDEVNRFDRDPLLWAHLIANARLIRHLGSSLVICGQDFLHLPEEMFGLCSIFGCFRVQSPRLFEHVRERIAGLRGLRFADVSELSPGWAQVAAAEATDGAFRQGAAPLYFRPLRCAHGGVGRAEL